MKIIKIVSIFILFKSLCFGETTFSKYNSYKLVVDKKLDVKVSENCHKCKAISILSRKEKFNFIPKFGQNAGVLICKELNGRVLYTSDRRYNQVTLCQFNDGSFTTAGALTRYLLKK